MPPFRSHDGRADLWGGNTRPRAGEGLENLNRGADVVSTWRRPWPPRLQVGRGDEGGQPWNLQSFASGGWSRKSLLTTTTESVCSKRRAPPRQ
jgi:hypothetical protein